MWVATHWCRRPGRAHREVSWHQVIIAAGSSPASSPCLRLRPRRSGRRLGQASFADGHVQRRRRPRRRSSANHAGSAPATTSASRAGSRSPSQGQRVRDRAGDVGELGSVGREGSVGGGHDATRSSGGVEHQVGEGHRGLDERQVAARRRSVRTGTPWRRAPRRPRGGRARCGRRSSEMTPRAASRARSAASTAKDGNRRDLEAGGDGVAPHVVAPARLAGGSTSGCRRARS